MTKPNKMQIVRNPLFETGYCDHQSSKGGICSPCHFAVTHGSVSYLCIFVSRLSMKFLPFPCTVFMLRRYCTSNPKLACSALYLKIINTFLKNNIQGFLFFNARGALNCSPERFKESCQESDSYEHH